MLFKPIKEQKQRLYENIVLQIKALILDGNLKPGEKLPAERELAGVFGVSRSCIREATKSLATMGLIKVVHGQGVFVSETNASQTLDQTISHIFVPGTGTMRDLFELRKLIEPQAAGWAAQRRTEDEAAALVAKVVLAREFAAAPAPNIIKIWEHDTKFHSRMAMMTHNQVLIRVMSGILDLMAESRKSTFLVKDRPPKSVEEHYAVAKAIADGNETLAHDAMLKHLNNVQEDLAYL